MSPGPITLDVPEFEARRYMAHKLRECARLLLQSNGSVSFHEDHSIERDPGADGRSAVVRVLRRHLPDRVHHPLPIARETMTTGIPTMYSGVQFRSRLEARWAAFFDGCGWAWEYEPFDLDGWIPDFILLGSKKQVLVECKPDGFAEDLQAHAPKIVAAKPKHEVMIVGFTIFPSALELIDWPCLGLISEGSPETADAFAHCAFFMCPGCGSPTFCNSLMSYQSRICGHYDGDNLGSADAAHQFVEQAWKRAVNVSQWRRAG